MLAIIRKADILDIDQLISLCHEHASFEGASLSAHARFKEDLTSLLTDEQRRITCLIVEQERVVIAYATFMIQYSTWAAEAYLYMDCLYVREEFRERGFGAQLMIKIADFAKQRRLNQIQWQTPADNEKAISFYQKMGAIAKEKARFFWTP